MMDKNWKKVKNIVIMDEKVEWPLEDNLTY
jgi:hypothetical protein